MSIYYGGVNRIPPRQQPGAVFIGAHGADTIKSVSGRGTNAAGFPMVEIPEGQVMTWAYWAQRWMPLVIGEGVGAVAAANTITLTNPRRFTVGDKVYIVGVGYRTITERTDTAIIVDGAALTFDADTLIVVDHGVTNNTVASQAGAVLTLNSAVAGLKVGMKLVVGDGLSVKAFTPVVANAANYALRFRLKASGKEKVVPYLSDADATAKEIVEGVGAAVAADAEVIALVAQADDDAKLYITFDPDEVEVEAITSNLNAADASRTQLITAINTGTKAVTLANEPYGVTAGNAAMGHEVARHYKLACATVRMVSLDAGYVAGNIDVPTRSHGEVRERLVNGLTDESRAYLEAGGIVFNPMSW